MGRDLAVGVDLVEVDRFVRALRRWPGLITRVFSDDELDACLTSANPDERLAVRFAAKEAAFKALGDGWPSLRYHDVRVTSDVSGAPVLMLDGRAAELAGSRAVACSLSHERGFALAEVILHATEEG